MMRIPVCILLCLTGVLCQDLCDPGWTRHDSKCLRAYRFRRTQPEALSFCQSLGPSGNLASVSTKDRFDAINSLVRDYETHQENFWIGLYIDNPSFSPDLATRMRGWQWSDGSFYVVPDDSWGWNPWGEPGEGEQFVRMRSNRWLATSNDGEQNYFFCQKDLPSTTTTTTTTTTQPTTTTTPTTTTIKTTTPTTTTSPTTTTTTQSTTTTTPTTTTQTSTTSTTQSTTTTLPTTTTTLPTTTTTLSSTLSTSSTQSTTSVQTTSTTKSSQKSSPTPSASTISTSKTTPTTISPKASTTESINAIPQSTTPKGSFNQTGRIIDQEKEPLKPEIVAIAVVVAVVLVLVVIIVIFACLRRSGSRDVMSSTLRSNKSYAVSQPSVEQNYIYDEVDDVTTFSNGSVKKPRNGSTKSMNGNNRVSYVNNNNGSINRSSMNRTNRSSKLSDRFSWMMDRISTTALKEEFEKLNKAITTFGRRINVYRKATMRENYTKNRSPGIIPLAPKRVILKTEVPGKNDYINAVFVDSYEKSNAFIATIAPLASTVSDFWRCVYDYESPLVIMLCPQHHLKLGEIYFPENTESDSCVFEPFEATVSCNSYEKVGGLEMRDLALVYAHKAHRLRHFCTSADLDTLNQKEKINFFIQLYEQVKKWQLNINDTMSPMVVHCLDGVQWTGVLCSLFYTFDKVSSQGAQNADVIEIIQEHRLSRPQFISNEDQLRLVLETVSVFAMAQANDKKY